MQMYKFSWSKGITPLSNYYILPNPMFFDGLYFTSSEAAYQSHKTADSTLWTRFTELSPDDAKHLGGRLKLRDDWEDVKIPLMYRVVESKFITDYTCLTALMSTGHSLIVEDTTAWHDNIWGTCGCERCRCKTSENLLGLTLTTLRENIFNHYYDNNELVQAYFNKR